MSGKGGSGNDKPVLARPTIAQLGEPTKDVLVGMRFTGRLMLSFRTVRGFLNVPAVLSTSEDGNPAFVCQRIDTIFTPFLTMQKSEGDWLSVIQPGSMTRIEPGLQYIGVHARPALRLNYIDTSLSTPKRLTSIVSFPTENQRDLARKVIEKAQAESASSGKARSLPKRFGEGSWDGIRAE